MLCPELGLSSDPESCLLASRGVIALAHHHRSASSLVSAIKPIYDHLLSIFANGSPQAKETALTTLGLLSRRVSDDKFLSQIGAQLVVGLGDKAPWLRSLAHTTVRYSPFSPL
jgi:hypothetical protein